MPWGAPRPKMITMSHPALPTTSALDVKSRLEGLYEERALACLCDLAEEPSYMDDLEADIASTRDAFVGAAVTELATLRGELGGRLQG